MLLLPLLLVAACAGPRPLSGPGGGMPGDACAVWLAELDAAVVAAGVRDVQTEPVPGHPYLRVDRLLASFAAESPRGAAFDAWLAHAVQLARDGWRVELANLPPGARAGLPPAPVAGGPLAGMDACAARLAGHAADTPPRRAALLAAARVPDAYRTWQRVVGLYPLTRYALLTGYRRWQAGVDALYAQPLAALPVSGTLRRYASAVSGPPPSSDWPRDALGIPRPAPDALARLFGAHAPVWEVDTASGADLPGQPRWSAGARYAAVDTTRPTLYRKLSHARWGGRVLLQLNYLLWFPGRPPAGPADLYAGRFDGLLFRVTLGDDGQPLLYDAIHPCGCFHMFFPTRGLLPRPPGEVGGEGFHVPQPAVYPGDGERLVLRVAARTHQLLRVYADRPGRVIALEEVEYDRLRSMQYGENRRSLFGPDGLVAGSVRAERWLLWPGGVPSSGAMRQWGRHATAFVGRRHFDDPWLIDAGFLPAEEAGKQPGPRSAIGETSAFQGSRTLPYREPH